MMNCMNLEEEKTGGVGRSSKVRDQIGPKGEREIGLGTGAEIGLKDFLYFLVQGEMC